jgi:hypothetical protein
MSNLSLADAIALNDPQRVAECLDRPKVTIGEDALMAMVKLAWGTRGTAEDPDVVEKAERARRIYDMLVVAEANFQFQTARGTVIERIAKAQPEWPIGDDLPTPDNHPVQQPGRSAEEIEEDIGPVRVARGAMHRHRPR